VHAPIRGAVRRFLISEEKTVTCPLHLSVFSLIDGKAQYPPVELPLKVYQTKVENSIIYALIEVVLSTFPTIFILSGPRGFRHKKTLKLRLCTTRKQVQDGRSLACYHHQ
jgi:hypothetical protein